MGMLNNALPPDIRVQCIQRTSKGFDARFKAHSRVYRYCCPSYIFNANVCCGDIESLGDMFYAQIIERAMVREEEMGMDLQGVDVSNLVKTAKQLLSQRTN